MHGFDLRCASFLGGREHCFVSGADDEKVSLPLTTASFRAPPPLVLSGHAASLTPY